MTVRSLGLTGALAALLVAAPGTAATGENWKAFSNGTYGADVDVASITKSGTLRMFRLRSTKKDASKWAIIAVTLDCTAQTMKLGETEVYDGDKKIDTQPADPNGEPITMKDDSGRAIIAFVCGG